MTFINSITIYPQNITVKKGKWYYGACAEICPIDASCQCITWHSSNSNIASINQNGYICGVSEGSAVIYAVAQDGSGTVGFCNVTVVAPIKVSSVVITPSTKTVNIGDTFVLSATICPDDAEDKRIRWTSNDCNIAEVDYITGMVTAKSVGTTYICANAIDGSGVRGCCTITVSAPVNTEKLLLKPRNGSIVEIKRTASSNGETICSISTGTFVDLINVEPTNTKWYKILWHNTNGDDIVGWCSGENLQYKKIILKVKYESGMILRSNPSHNNYTQVHSLMKGAMALLLDEDKISNEGHDYYKVHYDNMEGYVTADDDEDFDLHIIWQYLASNITITHPITNISVTPSNPAVGETVSLNVNVVPNNATDKSIDWISCDESVATINSNGEVTGINVGTAVIVASARDGSGVIAYITIEVTEPESIKELRIKSSSSTNVAIKKNPSNGSETVGYISNNTIVELIDEEPQNTKWYKIYWKDSNGNPITGWCQGEYLQYKITMLEIDYHGGMFLRSEPLASISVCIVSLNKGDMAFLLNNNKINNQNHKYYKVLYGHDRGYITADDDSDFILHDVWLSLVSNSFSEYGVEMLKKLEGFCSTAQRYNNPATGEQESKYTIGYGHVIQDGGIYVTINGVRYSELTEELATTLLINDLNNSFILKFNEFLNNKNIALNQNQYDSCIIDCYQKGVNIWTQTTNKRLIVTFIEGKVNFDNYNEILSAFIDETNDPGRINRRTAEANLFFYGAYYM